MSEKPLGIALIICDRVITDALTQEKTLVASITNLRAARFPARHPRLTVFVALTNGNGQADCEIKCVNETEKGEPVFGMKGIVPFTTPMEVVELAFQFNNLTFPKPGLHSIEFLCDGEIVLQRRFSLRIATPNKAV